MKQKTEIKAGSATGKPLENLGKPQTENLVQAEQAQRKRGRPKGSLNKTIRKDHDIAAQQEPGENSKFLSHEIKLFNLEKIDINNPVSVKQRVNLYFELCNIDDIRPSVAGLALAFNVSRFVLFDYLNNRNSTIKNLECLHTIKAAYNIINAHYENMMNTGKINPVSGIFLMKNNMGYKDTTDYIIATNDNNHPALQDIVDRAGLLTDE